MKPYEAVAKIIASNSVFNITIQLYVVIVVSDVFVLLILVNS